MRRAPVLLMVTLTVLPRLAASQGNPMGPEFRVNTFTTGDQKYPAAAADGAGNFIVVWHGQGTGGVLDDVYAQRFAVAGAPLGTQFRVNTYITSGQALANVAVDPVGDFVVAWTSDQDGSSYGVFGQRFAPSGAPAGPEFRVNTATTGVQIYPWVSMDSTGAFVVVWESPDGFDAGVFGQRFSVTGTPLGGEFRVNTYTTGPQYNPHVVSGGAGSFVVVWSSQQDGSNEGIFGQRFTSFGAPLGAEFRVNTYTTSAQFFPTLATDASGGFVVTWTSQYQDGSGGGIFGQRFTGGGAPTGPEFRINTYTTSEQFRPLVAADSAGNFIVTWDSATQDGSTNGIFGQRFSSAATPLGPEFRANTFTTSAQFRPAVAAGPAGEFVVGWTSNTQDGSGYGIYAQRFGQILPVELMRFEVD